MPDEDARRGSIRDELLRIEEAARYSAQAQFAQAKIWRAVHLLLGVPAAGLAAIAGAAGLASILDRTGASLVALAAAGFGAVATAVNATRRAELAQQVANQYLALENDARIARTVDLPHQDVAGGRELLSELAARRTDINQTAEVPFRIAYWSARRNIAAGNTNFEVDG